MHSVQIPFRIQTARNGCTVQTHGTGCSRDGNGLIRRSGNMQALEAVQKVSQRSRLLLKSSFVGMFSRLPRFLIVFRAFLPAES